MPEMPAGAQVSEDGYYWWDEDGNQWQPIEQTAPAGAESTGEAGTGTGERTGTATAEGAERPADAQPVSEMSLEEVAQGDAPELSAEHQDGTA